MKNFLDDALGRSIETPAAEPEEGYKAFHTAKNGRPQMGFSYCHPSGEISGFYYQDISQPNFEIEGARQFLSFEHRTQHGSDVVTIEGKNLREFQRHFIRCTLMEMHEHHGQPVASDQPIITAIGITDIRSLHEEQPVARLVKNE
jgi:hypothetical protein